MVSPPQPKYSPKGFTLIEIVVTIGIMVLGILAITQLIRFYFYVVADEKFRVSAAALGNQKLELIRNLPYNDIGTIGGIPSGNLPQTETISKNNKDFTIKTEIIYIDDPADGLISTTGVNNSIYHSTNPNVTYYWAMENNLNGQAPDIGNGTLAISGPTTIGGKAGNGLLFDNNDTVSTVSSGNINTTVGRIGLWYKPNNSGNSKEYFLSLETTNAKFEFYRDINGKMVFRVGSADLASPNLTWSTEQWYFLEAAWDDNISYRQIWRNGVPIALNETNFSPPGLNNNLYIGHDNGSDSIDGIIDELFILNNAYAYQIWGYNQSYAYFPENPQVSFFWNLDSISSPQTPGKGTGEISLGGYVQLVNGAKNQAVDFSENNRLVWSALPLNSDNIDLTQGRIGFWYKPDNTNNESVLFNGADCNGQLRLSRLPSTDQLQFSYGSLSDFHQIITQSLEWDTRFWYFIEAAWHANKNSLNIFRDRILIASSTTAINSPSSCQTLYLGNQDNISYNDAAGVIDEFYILKESDPYSAQQDLLNTDYKRVKITISWETPFGTKDLYLITDVAPPGMETTAGGGTIILHVYNAYGLPVENATVNIFNDNLAPIIDLSLTTNPNGKLILPGAPATSSYQILVTKNNYSSDYTLSATSTYINPVRDHLVVLESQVTEVTFFIDQVSNLAVNTVSQTLPHNWKINTDSTTEDQFDPVVVNTDTAAYFAWSDLRNINPTQVYSQKYNLAGTKIWSDDIAIAPGQNQLKPRLALDINENLYLAWQDDASGNYDIKLAKYSAAGTDLWGAPVTVSSDFSNQDQVNPDLVYANNEIYLVWQDERNDSGDIYFNKFDLSGNRLLASDLKINTDSGSAVQTNPKIINLNDGNLYVAWLDNRQGREDIFLTLIDFQGNLIWANEQQINSSAAGIITNYDLARAEADNCQIVWSDNRNTNFNIYWQAVASTSAPVFLNDQNITTLAPLNNQQNVRLVVDENNDQYFAWQDDRSGNLDVYILKTDIQGTALWPQEIKINLVQENDQILGDISIYQSDRLLAVWTDYNQGEADIWAGTLNYDGTEIPVPFVDFALHGSKLTHTEPDLLKYTQNFSSNSSGQLNILNLEWDTYTIEVTDPLYSLIQSQPSSPFQLSPGTTTELKLIVD